MSPGDKIETPEQLDALPNLSIVTDLMGDAWQKAEGPSYRNSYHWITVGHEVNYSAKEALEWGPFTLVKEGS